MKSWNEHTKHLVVPALDLPRRLDQSDSLQLVKKINQDEQTGICMEDPWNLVVKLCIFEHACLSMCAFVVVMKHSISTKWAEIFPATSVKALALLLFSYILFASSLQLASNLASTA